MKLLKIFFILVLLSITNFAFALNAPENIKLNNATHDTLEISWDKTDWAFIYAISYWTKTASGTTYENQLEVIVHNNEKWLIENLKENTKYFIAVKAFDSDNNESEYSKEVYFSTLTKLENLRIEKSNVLDTRNIELEFNFNLNKDSVVNLNIVNMENNLEDIEVKNYKIAENKLYIFLKDDLIIGSKYSITVITLEWSKWEKIKSGVEWMIDFYISKDTKKYSVENIELLSAWEEEKKEEVNIELLSAWEEEKINIQEVAEKKEELPTAWPSEMFLLLLFSLIIWAFLFYFNKRRNA